MLAGDRFGLYVCQAWARRGFTGSSYRHDRASLQSKLQQKEYAPLCAEGEANDE